MAIETFTTQAPAAPVTSAKARTFNFEGIVASLLMGTIFLLPLVAFPSPFFSFQFAKSVVLSVMVIASFILFLFSVLKNGTVSFPFHLLPVSLIAVALFSLISAIVSPAPGLAIFGYGFETDTVMFLVVAFLYFFLISTIFKTKEKIFYSYLLFLGVLFLLALYHIARFFFGPDFLSFNLYTTTFSNTIGKWNELGIFFGIGTILSLITLEMMRLSPFFKALLYTAFGVSLLFAVVVNFTLIWIILGVFSLAFFVFLLSSSEKTSDGVKSARKISWVSLIVLILSIVFLLWGGNVGNYIASWIGASSFEVRPSWSATWAVTETTLKTNPVQFLLGAGPNRFFSQWLMFKPASVNTTSFWDTTFNYGIGIIPSSLVTVGILGTLSWILFLCLFLFTGFKAAFVKVKDVFSQYLITSSFFVSLYLWLVVFFYVPGVVIFALAFFFTGLFFAALAQEGIVRVKTLSFTDPKISFVSILVSVFLLIGSLSYGYIVLRNGVASAQFEKGVIAYASTGNLDTAEGSLVSAIQIAPSDVYYRTLSELNRVRIDQIVNRTDVPIETTRADFQRVFAGALDTAQRSVNANESNHQNWLALGRVYAIAVAANIERDRAYELARSAYLEALTRNPHGPSLYLDLARLEIAKGDLDKAKEEIANALKEKENYTEAVFLLSQIEVSEGNINGAISSVEGAAVLDPNNPVVFFQLGLLKYNKKDYAGAATAFEQAVGLNPVYANAKYFLGLSYYELRRRDDAIAQFEDVLATNPSNEEVSLILENLKAGKAPFANATPSLENPEDRDTLPIEEEE